LAKSLSQKEGKEYNMRRPAMILSAALLIITVSCSENSDSNNKLEDPADVHPPAETITDSTAIVNDSVIVPDTGEDKR
jgi:hypothetical protein